MFIDIVGHNGKIIHSVLGGDIMFKKFVLASVNFFLSSRTVKLRIILAIAWIALAAIIDFTGPPSIYMVSFVLALIMLFAVGFFISLLLFSFSAVRPVQQCFTFNEDGVVRVFDFEQFIWKKDFDAMKPNLASYETKRAALSFKCTDEQDNVSIIGILVSFGGTPEEMLEVIRRFGNNGIIDEMKRRLEAGGVCNIDATNNLSIVQGILGESVHVLQIKKEQSLYCTIDTIYL